MRTKVSLKNTLKLIKIPHQHFYPFDFPPRNNTVDHSKFQSLLNGYSSNNLCFLKPPNSPPNLTENNIILIVIISIIGYYFYKKN
jgi:hypothetical protein